MLNLIKNSSYKLYHYNKLLIIQSSYKCSNINTPVTSPPHDVQLKSTTSQTPAIPHYEIAISGGGIVGAAVACALSHYKPFFASNNNNKIYGDKQGMVTSQKKIILIDPSKSIIDNDPFKNPIPEQRVFSLTNSTINFFKSIGVWELLDQSRIKPISAMQVWEIHGKGYIKFGKNSDKPLGYVAENGHILWALHQKLKQLGTCEFRIPQKIEKISIEPTSFANVTLSDAETFTARLLIGSDGANSFVKKASNISSWGWSTNQSGIVCTLKTGPNSTAWQRFTPSGPIAILPLWGDYSSLVWSCTPELHQYLMNLSDNDFINELNHALTQSSRNDTFNFSLTNEIFDFPPIIQGMLNKRLSFPLNMLQSQKYTSHRIALIGDAAHSIHPLAGQGLNLGIVDVVNLANEIIKNVKVGNDIGSENCLNNYEIQSKAANYAMMFGLEAIKRSYEYNSWQPFIHLRNLATNVINNFTPGKTFFIDFADGKYFHPKKYEWNHEL